MGPAPFRRKARRRSLGVSLVSLLFQAMAVAAESPPIVEAGEVTISSTRTARGALQIPGNVTRIDQAAIVRSGASSLPELLRREAGIYVTNTTTNPEGFTVEARGFNNGGGNGCSTLLLVDGRRMNEPDTGCPDWSYIQLDEIEHIEIVRGPASAEYGDNASAGVIQIFTHHPSEDGVRTATHLSTGSYGNQVGSGRVEGRAGGVTAKASFDHNDMNGYRDESDFGADASRLGLGFALGEGGGLGELRIDGGYDSNTRKRPGALTQAEMNDDRRQADPASFGDFDHERARFVQTALVLTPSEDLRIRLLPYLRRRDANARLSGDDGSGGSFDFLTDTQTDQLAFDGQAAYDFDAHGRRHTFVAGADLRRDDSDVDNEFLSPAFGDSTTDVHLRRDAWGLFAQQELNLADDWMLLLGLRYDEIHHQGSGVQDFAGFLSRVDVDETQSAWSPKASLSWRVAEPASLYLSYAKGFRGANVQETISLFGVEPLEPQRTESYEVGGKYRRGPFTANLALFWMNVEDEILFDPNTFSNRNLERVRHRGIELSGSARPLEWLEFYASYTLDDVRIQHGIMDAGQMPITPRHRGAAGAIAYLPCGFELGIDGRWVGSRPYANDLDNDSKELSAYAVYDARVAWRGAHGPFGLVLEAMGKNLTNRKYEEFGGEATFGGPPGFFPSPERNYVLGLRLEYRR